MPGIEFVSPEPDEGEDEELDTGARRAWSPRTKLITRIAAGVVLAAVAASIAVGVATRSDDHHTAAGLPSGTDRNALAPEAPPGAFRVDHLGATAPEGARPGTLVGTPSPTATPAKTPSLPGCPSLASCTRSTAVPAAVFAAVEAVLPVPTRVTVTSVSTHGDAPGGMLLTRTVTARSGALRLTVDVHQLDNSTTTRAGRSDSGTSHLVYASTLSGGLGVSAVVLGPKAALPTVSTLRTLVTDRRLLVDA